MQSSRVAGGFGEPLFSISPRNATLFGTTKPRPASKVSAQGQPKPGQHLGNTRSSGFTASKVAVAPPPAPTAADIAATFSASAGKHRVPRARSAEPKPAGRTVGEIAANATPDRAPTRTERKTAEAVVSSRRRDNPSISTLTNNITDSKRELQRLQELIGDTSKMLGGVRSQLASKSEEERRLHAQADALTEMAKSLLTHVDSVQRVGSGAADLHTDVDALKQQVAFATQALSQLSDGVSKQYSDGGGDGRGVLLASSVPTARNIHSFIDDKISAILSAAPVAGASRGSIPSTGSSGSAPVAPPKRPPPALPPQLQTQAEKQQQRQWSHDSPDAATPGRPVTPPYTPPTVAAIVGRAAGRAVPVTKPPQPYEESDDEGEPTAVVSPMTKPGSDWKQIVMSRLAASDKPGTTLASSKPHTNVTVDAAALRIRSKPVTAPDSVPELCPECSSIPPSRRCHECSDFFCDACFAVFHRRGARQAHLWSPVDPTAPRPQAVAKSELMKSLGLKAAPSRRSASMEPLPNGERKKAVDTALVAAYRKATQPAKAAAAAVTPASASKTGAVTIGSAAGGLRSSDLINISSTSADLGGALSELAYKANPGLFLRQRPAVVPDPAPAPPERVYPLTRTPQNSLARLDVGGGFKSVSFSPPDEATPASKTTPTAMSHFQLSPKGELVVGTGRQTKEATMEVLRDTAAIAATTTTEAKIKQRAVLLRQHNAANKHVARTTDWATAEAIASDVQSTLFRRRLV